MGRRRLRLWLRTLPAGPLLAMIASLTACSDGGAQDGYPVTGLYLSGFSEVLPPMSLQELISASDLIAIIEPTGERSEVWNAVGSSVSSRFPAVVKTVLKGPVKPGDEVVLFAPGGRVRETFAALESRKPAEDDARLTEEYVDYPFFREGGRELVFLRLRSPDERGYDAFFYMHGTNGRYQLKDGHLKAIYPSAADVDDPGGVRAELTGKTLDWLRDRIAQSGTR